MSEPGNGAARRGERRQVTAIFCDLVNSVPLTLRLDPEDMMHIVELYLAACDQIIGGHGGYIVQYIGDGVLAYFGYPRADEDDAANAVSAGLALRDEVGRLNLPHGVTLQVRVGIATGLVAVTDLIGGPAGRRVGLVGETPNLAARLQSIARPGTVVVAQATHRLTRGLFTYDDLGPQSLKGFDTPVRAFEAVAINPRSTRFLARVQDRVTPLVGRERDLAVIMDRWSSACRGDRQVVLVQGEAGIGKSRLVEELRANAADTPHLWITWHCSPTRRASAFHPISEQLSRAAGLEGAHDVETRRLKLKAMVAEQGHADIVAIQAVLGDIFGLTPEADSPITAMSPERRREVTLATLAELAHRRAGESTTVLVLEDAHWSDSSTLEVLDRLISQSAGRRWLIVVTARPEFRPAWLNLPGTARLPLDRLDRLDSEEICTNLGANDLLPVETIRQIVTRCEGVPLFVEEMTKSVLEATAVAEHGALTVPMSIKDSLVARLDRLGSARAIANLGAAIGRRFSYNLLAAVAESPARELREGLRDLVRSGLVETRGVPPSSDYTFNHALVRDAAYDSLLKRERQMLHTRIAAVLRDRLPQTRQTEPELLAYHCTESGAIAEAIPLWAEAGQRAAAAGAHVEAVGHIQNALELLRRQPESNARRHTELQLLLALASSLAFWRGFSAREVGDALLDAEAICDTLGNDSDLFATLRGLVSFRAVAGDIDASENMARRCMEIADRTGILEQKIESTYIIGYSLLIKGHFGEAKVAIDKSDALYPRRNGIRLPVPRVRGALSGILAARLGILYAMGDEHGAASAAAALETQARTSSLPSEQAEAFNWLSTHHIVAHDYMRALDISREGLLLAKVRGYKLHDIMQSCKELIAMENLGHTNSARSTIKTHIDTLKNMGVIHLTSTLMSELANVQAMHGDLHTALKYIDDAILSAHRYREGWLISTMYIRRAEILSLMPAADLAAVRQALNNALAIAESQGAAEFAKRAIALLRKLDAPSDPRPDVEGNRPETKQMFSIS